MRGMLVVLLTVVACCSVLANNMYRPRRPFRCADPRRLPRRLYCGPRGYKLIHGVKCCCLDFINWCPKEYDPVCGSDNVEYGNKCNLCYAMNRDPRIKPLHYGPCPNPRPRY